MVGEIRDAETASIAVQAGLTGHLILTTVHADSAAGVFNRVIETGVEPFLIASASLGIFSQRLVRTVCPHCRTLGPPSPVEIESLMRDRMDVRQGLFPIAVGCEQCEGKGYIGRTVIGELLVVTPKLQELVHSRIPTSKIHNQAIADGMKTLLEDGINKARGGQTTLAEVLRVAGQ
jgi:general secretion pathway protein E